MSEKQEIKKGKFIVLEGGEGAGKGSCIEDLFKERLKDRNDILFTREPGGTPVAEEIRDLLLRKNVENRKGEKIDALTELFLFCAARAQHIISAIKPILESGKHVICDRFDLSTIAYQIFGRERHDLGETFKQLNSIAKAGIEPDLLIYLDVDPKIGLARKSASKDGICTRFDEEKLEFHYRVRQGYLVQIVSEGTDKGCGLKETKANWYLIDTNSQTEESTKKAVWNIVEKTLKK